MNYAMLKMIHISAVAVSFCGFAVRGVGALCGASWVRHRAARMLPHVVDTVLLLSALGMLWLVRLAPWALPWLRAKIAGLVVYIALGMLALHPRLAGSGPAAHVVRLAAWIAALLVFGFIVSVALTKDPRGIFVPEP
jgi:uncharacterized membrane protein SirB2